MLRLIRAEAPAAGREAASTRGASPRGGRKRLLRCVAIALSMGVSQRRVLTKGAVLGEFAALSASLTALGCASSPCASRRSCAPPPSTPPHSTPRCRVCSRMLAASGRKLTRTKPRGHHTVRAGLLRAARTRGPRQLAPTGQYSTDAVRVPASGVMYVPRTTAPQVGPQAAVHRWPGAMDDSFLPRLDARLDAAADGGEEGRCAELMSLMEAIEQACATPNPNPDPNPNPNSWRPSSRRAPRIVRWT